MTNNKSAPAMQAAPLLISRGQFFVLTADTVQVHLLDELARASLFDRLAMAQTCRDPESVRQYAMRLAFRCDALFFLPAETTLALCAYVEFYEGMHKDQVRGIAACILTGQPYSLDRQSPSDPSLGVCSVSPTAPVLPPGGIAVEAMQSGAQQL